MAKYIRLTKGKQARVDDENYERLNQHNWYCNKGYAVRHISNPNPEPGKPRQVSVLMHREIMNAPKGVDVDHKNRNKLDNREENLRFVQGGGNEQNKDKIKSNTSGYKGVVFHKRAGKWQAQIMIGSKSIYLGLFNAKEQAAKAYDEAAVKYHGEFAVLNFPLEIR